MLRPRANFAKAFTLIELILVLVLLVVITSIALPSLSNFSRSRRVGDSADHLLALARWARGQAIVRGVNFRLNFDPSKNTYWLTMQNGSSFDNLLQNGQDSSLGLQDGSQQTTTQFGDVGDEPGRQFTLAPGVTFTCNMQPQADGLYVQFRPTGRCDPGTVTFSNGDPNGQIEVGCLVGTEQYHILTDDEKKMESNMQPPAPVPQSR